MMQDGFQRFLEAWRGEFSRSVEMFTGEPTALDCRVLDASSRPDGGALADLVWWRESIHSDVENAVWIGLPNGIWELLGDALGSDEESRRQVCLEMLSQALHGAAHVLSSGMAKALSVWDGKMDTLGSLDGLEVAAAQIRLGARDLPEVLVAIESKLAQALTRQDKPATSNLPAPPPPKVTEEPTDSTLGPAFGRLIDLELPMSVALGRATLPIRDVLKITAGSLIELDHRVGESVDVLVHGKVVARGEVVSVKGNYGVRILEIIDRRDRMALRHGPRASAAGLLN